MIGSLRRSCCATTPFAMLFWAGAFLLVYGAGRLLGSIWPAFQGYGDTLIMAALGAACFINFARNRTLHCALSGPLFVAAALITALVESGVWNLHIHALWGVVLVGVIVTFIIEWRTVRRST
jgi:hypothetical protein